VSHDGARVVAGFIGKTGSGKSTELRRYADRSRRLLVADIKKDWHARSGDVVVEGYQQLLDLAERRNLADPSVGFRIVYRASREEMQEVPARFVMRIQQCTLALDEARLFTTASYTPPAMDELILTGRHPSVNILYATTRPQSVHPSLHDEADVVHLFRLEGVSALARVREQWPGFEKDLSTLPVPPKGRRVRRITGNFRIYGNLDDLKLIGREGLAR